MILLHDPEGPFLPLSPAEASDVAARLAAAGVAFREDDAVGAGCAGPETVVLRFDPAPGLEERVAAALAPS